MAFRLTRNLYQTMVPSGDVTTLCVIPIFHGETLGKLNGKIRIVSTPDVGNSTTYSSPWASIEYDIGWFFSPWSITAGYQPSSGSQPHIPANVSEWRAYMKKMILAYGSAANAAQYGDPDANQNKLRLKDNPAEPDGTQSSDNTDAVKDLDYPALGPQGFTRLRYETKLLSSMTKIDASVNSTATSVYTGDTKFNDVAFSDNIDLDMDVGMSGPGFLICAFLRHKPVVSKGYACSYGNETGVSGANVLAASDKVAMFNALHHGDYLRIKEILKDRTTVASNYLRTLLFMGDVSVDGLDSTNNPSLAGLWSNNNPIRENDLMATAKFECTYSTPYEIIPDLM